VAAALALGAAAPAPAAAQVFLTQDEALQLAFPGATEIERRTAYLDAQRAETMERKTGVGPPSTIVTYYVGWQGDRPLGAAYFDMHRVRTLPEVLMIVIDPGGRVDRIEVVRFGEPREYVPPAGWLDRFDGRRLKGDLEEKNAVAGMTGATLTSRAVTEAVRRTLALYAFLDPLDGSAPSATGAGHRTGGR